MGMMARQRDFFAALPQRLDAALPAEARTAVASGLFAGIALVEGETCMGEIGPRQGIRKFGILGDPLNLAARMESLTRHVRGHLLATESLVPAARALGLLPRRLGRIQFKGRLQPVAVWVLHGADEGVGEVDLAQWTAWLVGFEAGVELPVPAAFEGDVTTFRHWRMAGAWDADTRSFRLEDK
jgi:adenylate cyclase